MALGAKEAASSFILSVPKFHSSNKSVVSSSIRFSKVSAAALKFNLNCTKTKPGFLQLHSALQVNLQQQQEDEEEEKKEVGKWDNRRKLFVLNLPWAFSVVDIKKLFGECGVVDDVEIIKQKDGKSRGFAFVTMATGEEAQAAILKYDSHELSDRIIRVEFAKQFKRPIRTTDSVVSSSSIPAGETRHKLYVSNLGWKVRSTDLREFFSSKFKPLSVKVVFDSPSGKSAGYGFVSFATKEEADSAISQLNGTELLGRPVRLKAASEKNIIGTSQTKQEKEKEESSEKSIIDNSQNKEEEESTDKTSNNPRNNA
ncbi:hypothetical protein ABFS82_01G110600 [Erythranthe guttata]|uniref:RRM domain-containing protein n=1 Tax=Erythranthe guttata TaxID=4155 RepID=A0A022R0C1_ERYGU|nr:PREDICTED: 28 kDa ribonucleoprotein, chloroplastic [Erythranthe guttata]EYU34147.1 hypothetical protein MIMGU_mgv1a010436mg [Erythranthe guttata]|eukprot:XP_012841312.1 PREDICTED: 28 kDa ribonucleoprotein, chloroplastic [Erythranthe guttata]